MQVPNIDALWVALNDLKKGIPSSWIWRSSLDAAIIDATPNFGMKGRLSWVDRRLLKKGHKDLTATNIGIVIVCKTTATPIGSLTPSHSADEFLMHTEQAQQWKIMTACDTAGKTQILSSFIASGLVPSFPQVIDSNLWIAHISDTNFTDTKVPQTQRESKPCHDIYPYSNSNQIMTNKNYWEPPSTSVDHENQQKSPAPHPPTLLSPSTCPWMTKIADGHRGANCHKLEAFPQTQFSCPTNSLLRKTPN